MLELAQVVSGPYGGMLLAELGANVIKVEAPDGDITRGFPTRHKGVAALFYNVNRGKRSIAVDLRSDEGKAIVRELALASDVVVENWRPGVAARLGLGSDELRAAEPRLITVSVRGFGETGPLAGDRVYDGIVQGVSGMASFEGKGGEPDFITALVPDKLTGVCVAQGVLAALLLRERTGEGTHVPVSMLDAAISFGFPDMMASQTFAEHSTDHSQSDQPVRPSVLARAGDGCHFVCTSVGADQWLALCGILGRSDWEAHARNLSWRVRNARQVRAAVEARFATSTRSEALAALRAADVPCGPVNTPAELLGDPQIRANGVISEVPRSELGVVREAQRLVHVGPDAEPLTAAPRLGEHTDEILGSLGYDVERIAELRSRDVIS